MPSQAIRSRYTDVYTCDNSFFNITLFSSIILLMIGVRCTVARYNRRGPDFLGCLTIVVRDSSYTPLPKSCSSGMDTIEVARQIKRFASWLGGRPRSQAAWSCCCERLEKGQAFGKLEQKGLVGSMYDGGQHFTGWFAGHGEDYSA